MEARENGAGGTWAAAMRLPVEGVEEWGDLVGAYRNVSARLAASHPPRDLMRSLTATLEHVADQLEPHEVGEAERFAGRAPSLPARGHLFLIPVEVTETTQASMRARVTLSDLHLGGAAAAHGGTQPLLFDELLGMLVMRAHPVMLRTASLTVNYRKITPVGVELEVEASIDRIDGRKVWASGRLRRGDEELVDAVGLFILLRPESTDGRLAFGVPEIDEHVRKRAPD
ncbi:MAG: PaaI family thioesterase [Pseudonocardiaceae bacterium]